MSFFSGIHQRVIPAVLAAVGVAVLTAGLLTYGNAPAIAADSPTPPLAPDSRAGPSALLTLPPLVQPGPTTSVGTGSGAVATRVVVPLLGIDLPVVAPPKGPRAFPYCGVAMYYLNSALGQPGDPRPTYLFAHARTGMFLRLLTASQVNGGKRMLGMLVQVYTDDDKVHLYEVVEVLPHAAVDTAMNQVLAVTRDQLWLQTSEGPYESSTKLQVVADPLSQGPASHADAHPKPHPVVCG